MVRLRRCIPGMESNQSMSIPGKVTTRRQPGFTVVELLVVIAIIGVLVALLLPAVQAAREAARIIHCKNNLRQIGLAMLHYETAHQSLPAGGWSSSWTGDPNVRTGDRQPGGWIYQSLPFLEQQSIADIGEGLTGGDLATALTEQGTKTNPMFNCPSRRPAQLYPTVELATWNYFPLEFSAKTDYAANGGSNAGTGGMGPTRRIPFVYSDCKGEYPNCNWKNKQSWIDSNWNGIVGDHSGARIRQITDGAANTLLIGEKWLYQLYYDIASVDAVQDNSTNKMAADNPGDNGSMYTGYDGDNVRSCSYSRLPKRDSEYDLKNPQSDKKGAHYASRFGGPHTVGINLARCDGSVDTWSFDVDPVVWASLGARNDGGL